jgi:hypothetical protein
VVLGCIHQKLLGLTLWLVVVVFSEVTLVESVTSACCLGLDLVQNPLCLRERIDDCVVLDRTTKIAHRPEMTTPHG